MAKRVERRTVDLSGYPDLVVIYLGMRVNRFTGLKTLLGPALVAAAQIAGGLIVPWTGKIFRRRTSALLFGTLASASMLLLMGLTASFWIVRSRTVNGGKIFCVTPAERVSGTRRILSVAVSRPSTTM